MTLTPLVSPHSKWNPKISNPISSHSNMKYVDETRYKTKLQNICLLICIEGKRLVHMTR